MAKNIWIISSEYTGHGHKSIAQSVIEQFQQLAPDVTVTVKNGFEYAGGGEIFGKNPTCPLQSTSVRCGMHVFR